MISRSRLPARPTPARRPSPGVRRAGGGLCRRVGLLCGLLLLAGLPAHGFDEVQSSGQAAQELVLDSSGVPVSANWVVLDVSGTAAWRAEGETRWQRFTQGEVLPPGSEIETGADGEIMLVSGGDQLTIAPQGRLIVPLARPGQDRRLRHERGRILVQIESRDARDVRVDTPLLSLGIKGTTFEVEVGPEQDSVVVHDGEVEVTTPSQPEPVDLGAGEGLRQSSVPGADPTRFNVPGPGAAGEAAGEPVWRLPPAGTVVPSEPQTLSPLSPSDSTGARTQPDRTRAPADRAAAPARRTDRDLGWIDELASSWGYVAIVGVALLILTIPALALLQNLRQQWRSRPRRKGRRRRELVRG